MRVLFVHFRAYTSRSHVFVLKKAASRENETGTSHIRCWTVRAEDGQDSNIAADAVWKVLAASPLYRKTRRMPSGAALWRGSWL